MASKRSPSVSKSVREKVELYDRKIRARLECPRGWDWSARYSNNEMLVESYEWYLANRGAVLANTGAASHHQSAVEQGALKLLHWFL
jgi:hypothetical protein